MYSNTGFILFFFFDSPAGVGSWRSRRRFLRALAAKTSRSYFHIDLLQLIHHGWEVSFRSQAHKSRFTFSKTSRFDTLTFFPPPVISPCWRSLKVAVCKKGEISRAPLVRCVWRAVPKLLNREMLRCDVELLCSVLAEIKLPYFNNSLR